jgi:hypothetical protein
MNLRTEVDKIVSHVRWATALAFALLVPLYILEFFGVRVSALPSPQTVIYVAGIYYLTRG